MNQKSITVADQQPEKQREWTREEIDQMMVDDEYCPHCGGEGFIFDCIDGQCLDAEIGCDLCTTKCDYCQ